MEPLRIEDEARAHALKYKHFVTQLDAPTLKAAFDRSAELLNACAEEIEDLRTAALIGKANLCNALDVEQFHRQQSEERAGQAVPPTIYEMQLIAAIDSISDLLGA